MTKDELLACLTDRPCEVCKFHTDLGCSKWSCVFEDKTEGWIPCAERLPEEKSDSYICTCTDGHRTMVTCVKWQNKLKRWDLTGTRSFWKVLAWMPLPKPYEGKTK